MESRSLVVYTALSNREKVDADLQNIEVGNGKFYKHISLCNTTSDIKVASLYINNINNVEVKYEYIKNADINDIVELNGKKGTIRDIILDIKNRDMPLFTRVE